MFLFPFKEEDTAGCYFLLRGDFINLMISAIGFAIHFTELGEFTHDFWYNKDLDLIKMLVKNYKKQTLLMALSSVKK